MKKKHPEINIIPVTADRKLHEKPTIPKRSFKNSEIVANQINPQIQNQQKKMEIVMQLVRTISLEISELREKVKEAQEKGAKEKDMEIEAGDQSPASSTRKKKEKDNKLICSFKLLFPE